jgi:hypothetical protein
MEKTVKRIILTLLMMGGMLSAASAGALRPHGHHHGKAARHAYRCGCAMQNRAFYNVPTFMLGWAFGHHIPEAPHRRTRGSWNTGDADAVLQRSTDDANQRARDDANALQQQMLNNQ